MYTYTYKIQGDIVETNDALIPFKDSKCDMQSILKLEELLLSIPGADTSGGDLEHFFSEGLYARKLTLPAGSTIVGKIHLQGQINFLIKGTIRVTTDAGVVKTLTAPQIVVSSPGTKRAGHAITDVEWVTVCATDQKTPESAEAELVVDTIDDPRLEAKLCLLEQ